MTDLARGEPFPNFSCASRTDNRYPAYPWGEHPRNRPEKLEDAGSGFLSNDGAAPCIIDPQGG